MLREKDQDIQSIPSTKARHEATSNIIFNLAQMGIPIRDAYFIETEQAHFDLLKHGTDAVFVTPHCSGKTRLDLFPVDADGCNVTVTGDANGATCDAYMAELLKTL